MHYYQAILSIDMHGIDPIHENVDRDVLDMTLFRSFAINNIFTVIPVFHGRQCHETRSKFFYELNIVFFTV